MRSDEDIKRDVMEELKRAPDVDASDITVAVKDGGVMLGGFVPSFTSRFEAQSAAKRVLDRLTRSRNPERLCPQRRTRCAADTGGGHGQQSRPRGTVRSWAEREETERVAWSASGVVMVEDHIIVKP